MNEDTQARLDTAIHAVSLACRVSRQVQQGLAGLGQLCKEDSSPVTVADFASQAIIARTLETALGPLLMVGEEDSVALREGRQTGLLAAITTALRPYWPTVDPAGVLAAIDLGGHDGSAPGYWTLDPVDGTRGFLRGQQYAIALAWIVGGEVELGVLGCPNLGADMPAGYDHPDAHGLLFHAIRGQGCFLRPADAPDDQPIEVHHQTPTGAIRVCESVEAGHSRHDVTARVLEWLGGAGIPVRLDSQCKYGVVARGQADAYLRLPTRADYVEKIWDHAAGKLIAEEAGCIVTDIHDRPLDFSHGSLLTENRGVICASPEWHHRIIEAIAELGI